METKKRTQATDIAGIATKSDGKVKFSSIIYSQQMLSEKYREIEDCFNQLPGEPYPTIAINDVGNDDRMIEFYVTVKQYDVYHAAFKGFTKG